MKIKMLMAFVALLLFSAFTADRIITIFMIGDSTMANKPLEGGNQERGWGHVLGGYFSENIRVETMLEMVGVLKVLLMKDCGR